MAKKKRALKSNYYSASGFSLDRCYYLGQRFDEEWGYKPFEAECWVVSNIREDDHKGNRQYVHQLNYGSTGWLTRLWQSPSGAIFVSSATDAKVYYHPGIEAYPDRTFDKNMKLTMPVNGVWGLADDFVLAWGTDFDNKNHLDRYDGKEWKAMKSPPFSIRAMHGIAENLLCAVGIGGNGAPAAACWNGKAWKPCAVPTDNTLNSVFIAAADEIYAVGGSTLFGGNAKEWEVVAELDVDPLFSQTYPLQAVAKWKGEVWVGGGPSGLLKQQKKALTCIKPNIRAVDLDARGQLLITCDNLVAETTDGQSFTGITMDPVITHREGQELAVFK